MHKHKETHVSPWEISHEEKPLLDIEIAPPKRHQEMLQAIRYKRIEQHSSQKPSPVVIPKNLNSIEYHTTFQKPIRQKLKTHYESKRTYFSANKQQMVCSQKPKTQIKMNLSQKAIVRYDLIMNIPLISAHNRIAVERPIKHMQKCIKQGSPHSQRIEQRYNIKEIGMRLIGKQSVDSLSKRDKKFELLLRKSREYEEQIVKKCSLKTINIYEQDNSPSQGQQKKRKRVRVGDKDHILDRILSKFE